MKKTENIIEYIIILVVIAGLSILILQIFGQKISDNNEKPLKQMQTQQMMDNTKK